MLAAWALRNWKAIAGVVAVLLLLALAGLGFWRGMVAIERLQAQAAETARAERDAHWRAEIATANATVERAQSQQVRAAARADAAAREAQSRFETQLNDLEKANAALAGADACGIGRDRVRLLDEAR
jgi:uncharacterized protein YlxW (UPF0749 family)